MDKHKEFRQLGQTGDASRWLVDTGSLAKYDILYGEGENENNSLSSYYILKLIFQVANWMDSNHSGGICRSAPRRLGVTGISWANWNSHVIQKQT